MKVSILEFLTEIQLKLFATKHLFFIYKLQKMTHLKNKLTEETCYFLIQKRHKFVMEKTDMPSHII